MNKDDKPVTVEITEPILHWLTKSVNGANLKEHYLPEYYALKDVLEKWRKLFGDERMPL